MKRPEIKIFYCLLFLLLTFFSSPLRGQELQDSTKWEIQTKDGNIYIGYIKSQAQQRFFLETESLGTIAIRKKDIASKKVYEKEGSRNKFGFLPNRLSNKYMLMPTGMFTGSSKGSYENKMVFVNHVNVQLSEGVSIGGGMMPLVAAIGDGPFPIWISSKVRLAKKNRFELSAGAFYGRFLFDEYYDDSSYAWFYAMGTYGTPDINFSFGLGYGYWEYDWENSLSMAFGANVRLGPRMFLFSENILFRTSPPEYEGDPTGMVTFGARTMWRKVSLDYGIMYFTDDDPDYTLILPYLGLVVPFN